MDGQILYLIIGIIVGAVAIYFVVKKSGSAADNTIIKLPASRFASAFF